jgi:hypothetical protein
MKVYIHMSLLRASFELTFNTIVAAKAL